MMQELAMWDVKDVWVYLGMKVWLRYQGWLGDETEGRMLANPTDNKAGFSRFQNIAVFVIFEVDASMYKTQDKFLATLVAWQ